MAKGAVCKTVIYRFNSDRRLMGGKKSFYWEELDPDKLWYFIGLIAADGSLSKDGRHIDITSKNRHFLKSVRQELGIKSAIGQKKNGKNQISYRIQLGSKSFYNFLKTIGLETNKSSSMGELDIPSENFSCFLRGLIDGDGCIRRWENPKSKSIQWSLKISSGSEVFLNWLNRRIEKHFASEGKIYHENNAYGSCYMIKIGNRKLLRKIICACYKFDTKLSIPHKRSLALRFLQQ